MKIPADKVNQWEQLSLLGGGPIEVILRVGIFPEADHCQFQVEARTAGNRELIALQSRPHADWSELDAELIVWQAKLAELVSRLGDPFPG
jgi:hypothetical protein